MRELLDRVRGAASAADQGMNSPFARNRFLALMAADSSHWGDIQSCIWDDSHDGQSVARLKFKDSEFQMMVFLGPTDEPLELPKQAWER